MMSVYNTGGVLMYHKIAENREIFIPLSVQGVYIVRSGNDSAKVVI